MKRKLMAHMVYGYPTLAVSDALLRGLNAVGVEYIEVQIPFSDPLADGPVLTEANVRAARSTTTKQVFAGLRSAGSLRARVYIMCYVQTVCAYGIEAFCQQAARSGACGVIVPDLPYDQPEYEQLRSATTLHDLQHVPVLSPNMQPERLNVYLQDYQGLVYVTARVGVTGQHTTATQLAQLATTLELIEHTAPKAEIALGFGIQTPEDINALGDGVSTAVVGSAITSALHAGGVDVALGLVRRLLEVTQGAGDDRMS